MSSNELGRRYNGSKQSAPIREISNKVVAVTYGSPEVATVTAKKCTTPHASHRNA